MILFSKASLVRVSIGITMLLSMTACERDSYTSWSCNSAGEKKVPMVLRKAQMEFRENKLDYCGSLGNLSYFDQRCPPQIEQSSTIFITSSGSLKTNGQEYSCVAL